MEASTFEKLCIFMFFVFISSSYSLNIPRKIKTEFLCNGNNHTQCQNPSTNIIYSRADGAADSIHFLISSYGVPAVLMIRTGLQSNMTVDWNKIFNDTQIGKSITFSGTGVQQAHAILFPRLLEYNDEKDEANITAVPNNSSLWQIHELHKQKWINSSSIYEDDDSITLKIVNHKHQSLKFAENGSLSIQFRLHNETGRSSVQPKLQYSSNTTEFDFSLDDLAVRFNNSRFALELLMVTTAVIGPGSGNKPSMTLHSSLDDEHSPGVFKVMDWMSVPHNSSTGAYLQWKPVCYKLPTRPFESVSKMPDEAKDYPMVHRENHKFPHLELPSIAKAYFGIMGGTDGHLLSVSGTNVSYGISKDKFYVATQYTTWTASVGFGAPMHDSMSTLIIIIISCGLGLPVLLIVFGGIGVVIKKHRERNASPYRSIN